MEVIAFVITCSKPPSRMVWKWVETLVKFTKLTPEGVYGKRCPIFQNLYRIRILFFSRQIKMIHETIFKIYICMDGFSCRPNYFSSLRAGLSSICAICDFFIFSICAICDFFFFAVQFLRQFFCGM